MAQTKLNLNSLGDLDDGAARLAIDRAISAAVIDLDDRGDDEKDRKVTINLTLRKTDNLVTANVDCKVTVPAFRAGTTIAKIGQLKGEICLVFQESNPEHPDQNTFNFNEEKGGE